MKVLGFVGYSGSGKTTLIEGVVRELKAREQRVSVLKHAHHRFDIDHPGKDTYRHREAGAFEVMIASRQRWALMREHETPTAMSVHQLIAQLDDRVDWLLIEGFKDADVHKFEVWRPSAGHAALYPDDPFIVGVATDAPDALPEATLRPVIDLNQPASVVDWMLSTGDRFEYNRALYAL